MASNVPIAERPPTGLSAYWLGCWRHALKTLKDQGTWAWEQKPLLDEYLYALMAAEVERDDGSSAAWDRNVKRAALLADKLILSPAAQRAHGIGAEEADDDDPFSALDQDELAPRRRSA